jgi:hypothetical protein
MIDYQRDSVSVGTIAVLVILKENAAGRDAAAA